jgi:uncharacterized membrane protein (DUF106 family)
MKKTEVKRDPLTRILYEIKEEVKNDITGPVVASFGFVIALVWRDAIKEALDAYLVRAGLTGKEYLYTFISAIIVTIAVIIIMVVVTKFGRKKKNKNMKKEFKELQEEIKKEKKFKKSKK